MSVPGTVNCPRCGESVEWNAQNRWRPFCSERCKMSDFGAWATEAYRVAAEPAEDGGDPLPSGDEAR